MYSLTAVFVCCVLFGGARGQVMWFGMEGMNERQINMAIKAEMYYGEIGFHSSLFLLSSSSSFAIKSLLPEATHLFTAPPSTTLCVVKTANNFTNMLWRSEKKGIVIIGHAATDDVLTRDYSPECFITETSERTLFVSFQPVLPRRPIPFNHPALQRLRYGAVEPNPVIQKYVDDLSADNIEKEVKELSTGFDGKSELITRNSYSIDIGLGGCENSTWRCLSHVQKDLIDELNSIMKNSATYSEGEYTIEEMPFRNDMAGNIRVVLKGDNSDIVVLGAHMDSRNAQASSSGPFVGLAPGADDNGSGSAINIEIVRSLAQGDYKFKNTIHIVWFTGEEQGLLGSKALSANYDENDASIIAMFNNDMVGYTDPSFGIVLAFMNKYRSAQLTESCGNYSQAYLPNLTIGITDGCCSDQQSFDNYGYPAAGIFETPTDRVVYPEYHKSADQYDNGLINYEQVHQFGQANFACLLEFAVPKE